MHAISTVCSARRVAGFLLVLSACTRATPTSDGEAIRTTRERGLAAFNAGDIDQFMSIWPAEDIVVMVPNAPPIVGAAALRSFVEQAFAGARIEETLRPEEQ